MDDCNATYLCSLTDPRTDGCPRSRRETKRDIRYLGSADVSRAHDLLMSVPLAAYRYRSGDPRERLGFIIEDVEPSVAVDDARDQVDLYGYASLAVAALQEQNRRIEALEREIAALRANGENAPLLMCSEF